MENNATKMTASQRLEGLEQAVALSDQALGNVTMNLQTAINALTLLSKRVEAMIRLSNKGHPTTSENVSAEIVEINVEELSEKVEELKNKGVAILGDAIQENSFVVGRELSPETKNVVNKRMQFPVFGLKKKTKELLLGKKAGDIVTLEEGRNLLEVTEVYNIVAPAPMAEESPEKEENK